MPKRSNDFQKLIKIIYELIIPEGGTVEESAMVYDKEAKILREVDILISLKVAGIDLKLMVECRDRSRPASVEWIDSLIGKAESLNVNQVIAVSSKGFAISAEIKAKENGIKTLTLKEALDIDWKNFPLKPGILVSTDDTYRIRNVFYKDGDGFSPFDSIPMESLVEYNGEIIGDLIGVIKFFFEEYIAPQIDVYKKEHFLDLFKTQDDLNKAIYVEIEYHWPKLIVLCIDGNRIEIETVKYVVVGERKTMKVDLMHHILNDYSISRGNYSNIKFFVVQESDAKKVHIKWIREGNDKTSGSDT